MTEQFQLNRAGLLNFWYYDNEVLDFADGKLLLRGSNGSGKSVTMQSLITVLLDGRKSPDRLDPFGSRARKMEDYLLGEAEISKLNERTGYLWLEYKRKGSNRYITTGMGLRARRHVSLDFWGFVITDDRRIGHDLDLHRTVYSPEEGKDVRVPLTKKELTNRLEPGGSVVTGQREYMELVNRHVFGFATTEAYQDLIKLLIQLRSPKLSKDFKPTVIYEILNDSIPALSDDELRPLSETIENMDQIKQQLDQLERDRSALKKLAQSYDAYNRFMLAEKARGVVEAQTKVANLDQEKTSLESTLEVQRIELTQEKERLSQLEQEQQVLENEREELQQHDVFRAEKQLQEVRERETELNTARELKDEELTKKQRRERQLEQDCKKQEEEITRLEREQDNCLAKMELAADAASFAAHDEAAGDYRRRNQDYDFTLWKDEVEDYSQQLKKIQQAAGKYGEALARFQEAEHDHAQASRQLDEAKRLRNQLEEEQDQLKEDWLDNFHRWEVNTLELHLYPQEKQQTAQRLGDIFDLHKPAAVMQPVHLAHDRAKKQIAEEMAEVDGLVNAKEREIQAIQGEIQTWQDKEEPEPPRHPDTTVTRQALTEAGIPHLPLFAAVEFKEEISPQQRERLESAITQAGLLDALIVPAAHLAAVQGWDKVILPKPHFMDHTLADVLEPVATQGVDAESIDNVLRSIRMTTGVLESGDVTVDTEGNYRIALLSGLAPREQSSRYIGKEARRRYRRDKIAELNHQLAGLEGDREEILAQKRQLESRENNLARELEAVPPLTALEEQWQEVWEADNRLKLRQEDEESKRQRLEMTHSRMQSARATLQMLARELNLPESQEAYAEAVLEMNNYFNLLRDLEGLHRDIVHCRELIQLQQSELEDVQQDVDNLKGELNVLATQLDGLVMTKEKIQERLQELGAEEIHQRIQAVVVRLQNLPGEQRDAYQRSVNLDRDIRDGEKELAAMAGRLDFARRALICWNKFFSQELNFRFVLSSEDFQDQALLAVARKVGREYGHLLKSSDRTKISDRLSRSFYDQGQYLVEYRPDLMDHNLEGEVPNSESEWGENVFSQARRRLVIMLDYDGQKQDVYLALDKMEDDMALQQQLLSEKDRELYEEIILHSVGDIIRKRISRAENWVEEINKLMEQRDTSSGLTFSLRWKPRTAEQEEELDTAELVELLRRDPNLLKEEDMHQIARHFRSKIERAKAELADREKGETFHSIVQELLDYRAWFDFKLFFRKGSEQKRELTNNKFYTFSGGEKAMAMYIPLFSAAYSRYREARPDAPRLISLDEAFAGVDETNIRDMFDLMEKLGFNYIINSQSLWGDYDTARRLSVCELVRPQNVPWVTVIRYLWDGKVRHLVSQQEVAVSE